MNFFNALGHFFKSLFGANSTVVQSILHEVAPITSLAAPIIADVETDLKAPSAAGSTLASRLLTFLGKYDADVPKITTIANTLAALPAGEMLSQAAAFALSTFVPPGTAANLINLAIELAYAAFKKNAPVTTA